MGLDNGILMYSKDKIENYPLVMTEKWDETMAAYEYEIAYWRKCWQIRSDMYSVIDPLGLNPLHENDGSYTLTAEAVGLFNSIFEKRLSEETWDPDNESIWSWEECGGRQKELMECLKWCYDMMVEHQDDADFKTIFYDSW